MKITGFENIISIEKFEYCSAANEHEYCRFSGFVKEQDVDAIIGLVDSDSDFEDDDFKFKGHITEITIHKDISGVYIETTAIGKTCLYDQEKHSRIFQNEEKTFADILSFVESMSDLKHEVKRERTIKEIIFQNDETDWHFVKRLANRFGECIFAGGSPFIGKFGRKKVTLNEKDLIDYKYCVSSGITRMYCRVRRSMDLGDLIAYSNKDFFVSEKKYLMDKEKYDFVYTLTELIDDAANLIDEINVFIEATVTNNDDPDKKGRVQVSFGNEIVEDCMKDSRLWISRDSVFSSKGFGTVLIPSVDDKVRVHIYRGNATVVGCVREEPYFETYQNCNTKYIILDDKVFVEYTDGCLAFHNHDNKLELSEEGISAEIGDKAVIAVLKDKVSVQINKTSVEISSDINATSGKYFVEAKNDASITATNVNIKGKSGVSIN